MNCDSSIIDYYQNLKNVQMTNLTKDIKKAKKRHMDFNLFNSVSHKTPLNNDEIHQKNILHSKFKIEQKSFSIDDNININQVDLKRETQHRKGQNQFLMKMEYPMMNKREVVEQLHPNIFKQKLSYQFNEKVNSQQNENIHIVDRPTPT